MFQPNSVIAGRYQVVRLIGQGGMSNLYLAYDRKYNNATVVVKEMTASYSDPKEQQMAVDLFHREAKLLASLNHRHIPKVYDYFQFAGKYYLSMEYIDGGDLAVKLEETKGPLPEKQVLEWGEQIATVLFYLHKHDPPIVFRDVKPSNIMISSNGVKLIDFGIARHFDQAKKGDTMRIGSPGYAPPEQYAAQTDPRSDIYALGVTLHHALTGRDPTATSTPFLVPPARKLNPKLSEATAAMLARATQLDPSDRYQSALEMKKDIKHILQRNGQSTRVVGAPPALPQAAAAGQPAQAPAQPAPGEAQTGTGSSPTSAAPTPAAAGATAAGSQNGSQSGSLNQTGTPAAASGSGSLANPPNQGTQPQQAAPKKGRPSIARVLLAACLFVAAAALTAFAFMSPDARRQVASRAQAVVQSVKGQFDSGDKLENKLRESLLAGNPEALLPLFETSEFQELSQEKQELFRLNLLAAGSARENLHVLHLVVPEAAGDEAIWRIAAGALGALNGSGGMDNALFAIVPQTYTEGGLASVLNRAAEAPQEGPGLSFLVLGAEGEVLPETLPPDVLFLTSAKAAGLTTLSPLESAPYQEVFSSVLDSSSSPSVWGLPGTRPEGAVEARVAADKLPDPAVLATLIEQAREIGGRLILRAVDAEGLAKIPSEGEVLVLAISASSLPPLGPKLKGTAAVLSSPFEVPGPGVVQLRPHSPEQLTLPQARLFDALILAAVGKNKAFDGLTVTGTTGDELVLKKPILYEWTEGAWLPRQAERGENP